MISPILVLQSALLNYRHILKLKIIKYKRKKIFSYLLLSLNKQVKISIKYLAKQFNAFNTSNNKYSLVERLVIFILNLFFRTPLIFGRFLQHSAQVHKLIQDNKKTFKRAKFKKYKRRRRRNKFSSRWRWKRKTKVKTKKTKFSLKRSTKLNKLNKIIKKKKIQKKNKQKKVSGHLSRSFKKRKRLRRQKKNNNVKVMKRRIRKVLIRSFTRPLKRKRYKLKKYKLTEFTSTIKQLYVDTNKNIDFDVLNDIQTVNTFFVNSIPHTSVRKFFFCIVLGKWYKLLEKTYYYLTTPFWHLYNLRSRLLRHRLYNKPIVQQIAPQIQNSYIKYLIKYLANPVAAQMRINNVGTSRYSVDPFLLSHYINMYRRKSKQKITKLNSSAKLILSFNLPQARIHDNIKSTSTTSTNNTFITSSSIYHFLKRKSIRKFLKRKQSVRTRVKIKVRLLKLIRSLYMQRMLKIQRRKYLPFINVLLRMKRYFFILIRFKLIRLVWFALRAVSFRRTRPLFKNIRKVIATRAFLIKN
jgi:hypothetical protein